MSKRCRRRRRRHRSGDSLSISDRRLYRDPSRGRIAGVCAGIADYFDADTWLVRIIAVTGLLFIPQITFISYCVAWCILPKRNELRKGSEDPVAEREDTLREEYARQSRFDDALRDSEAETDNVLDHRRRAFRQCRESMTRIEKRIRGLETYVTSKRFELDREFRKM